MTDETETTTETSTEEKGKTRQMSFSVLDSGEIRAEFGEGIEPLTLNPADVPEHVLAAATVEGLIARSRGYTSKLEGDGRTPAALREATAKAFENLLAGVWKIERGGTGQSEYSIEVEAAWLFRKKRAEKKGETFTGTVAEAAEGFAKLTDDQKKELKAVALYRVCFAEIKAQRDAIKLAKLVKEAEADEDKAPM
jgi:hypothetical protein